jgi:hypothetical protein
MRDPPRPSIINRIIALNKQRLIRPLRILEVPAMARIRLDDVRLAAPVGVDQCGRDEVAVGDGVRVGEGEGVAEDGFNGAPDLK